LNKKSRSRIDPDGCLNRLANWLKEGKVAPLEVIQLCTQFMQLGRAGVTPIHEAPAGDEEGLDGMQVDEDERDGDIKMEIDQDEESEKRNDRDDTSSDLSPPPGTTNSFTTTPVHLVNRKS
jgi:hypothetical protein